MSGAETQTDAAGIRPAPQIAALPATTPFVGPEELAHRVGRAALLRLGANESAFGPSPRAVAALRAEAERTSWYGDPTSRVLRERLAQRHGCDPEHVVVAAGIDDLLGLAVRGYVAPGDLALTSLGTYPTFNYHVVGYGGRLLTVPYRTDGRIDLDALAAAAQEHRPAVVYVANPDNPSGSAATPRELAAFADRLPARTLFILDEAYSDFLRPDEILAPAIDARIIRMRTFSKAYGLAGARIAYSLAAGEVGATFQKIRLHYGVSRNAQVAALASLDDDAFVRRVVDETAAGREEYRALAARLGLAALPSKTNFVCIDVGSAARSIAFVEELLQRGVFIRRPFAPPLDRFIRVTVGTPAERAAFAEAFAEAVARPLTNIPA